MKRLTRRWGSEPYPNLAGRVVCEYKECALAKSCNDCVHGRIANRLAAIEDILGDEYDLDRLRELAEADRLIGMTVYEPNKRGFISTYEIISVHISKCSILVGWNLLDGVYSNLNGFEISALGKTIFLTCKEAEAAISKIAD